MYDIAVIGSGPAGISAAVTALVRGKSVAVVSNPASESGLYKAERIDNYPGNNCLMLGKWSGEDGKPAGNMTNARIYQKVHLKAGHYFFGATFNALYQLGSAYIYAANEPLNTSVIGRQAIAYLSMSRCSTDGNFHGINFDLEEEQDVVLAFQANMEGGNANQEFRVDAVKLLYCEDTGNLTQTDITKEYLLQAQRFSREQGQSTTSRYGKPANWTVENYRIPTGEGTRQGLDRYPGYDCLTLGVWDDRQNNTEGNLSNARVYRQVTLPAGHYYFGAAYEANYQLAEAYIFAAEQTLDTPDIPAQSIAYDKISDAGKDNTTFRGIYFELDKETTLLLGFQADLNAGAAEQEFRASKVKLVRYGVPTGIKTMEDGEWNIEGSPLYDLQGRRTSVSSVSSVSSVPSVLPKGVYISQGKKIVIR